LVDPASENSVAISPAGEIRTADNGGYHGARYAGSSERAIFLSVLRGRETWNPEK